MQEKMAIDLLPPVPANKGTATLQLIQEYNLHGGVYLGDDITDIEAFRAIRAASRDLDFQGLAIGVTSREMPEELVTEVDSTLDGVGDVEHFLQWMSQILPQLRPRLI
jgi:trehalose 6-phosphate phosphatase